MKKYTLVTAFVFAMVLILCGSATAADGPDITVTNLTVDDTIQAGTTTQITYNVSNIGTTNSENFVVGTWEGRNCINLRTISLAAGQITPITVNWKPTTAGNSKIIVRVDVNKQVTETNESNNYAETQVTISEPRPDLEVTNLQVTEPAAIGNTQTITVNLVNNGIASGPFKVGIWDYAVDEFYSGNCIALIDVANLGQGGTMTINQDWIPTTAGDRRIVVRLDMFNVVTEFNEANNYAEVPITVEDIPDLEVSNLSVPTTANIGLPEEISFNIMNNGVDTTSSFVVGIWDGNNCISLQTISGLTSGEMQTIYFDWTPTIAGDRNIIIRIDVFKQISEYDESNNYADAISTVIAE